MTSCLTDTRQAGLVNNERYKVFVHFGLILGIGRG